MPELTSGRIKFMNYVTQRKFILLDYLPRGVLVYGMKNISWPINTQILMYTKHGREDSVYETYLR